MTKDDIKKGTIYIGLFSVIVFIIIMLFMKVPANPEDETAENPESDTWGDSLRNETSDLPQLAGMNREIERFLAKWEIKGLSVAVSRHDSLLYARGFGWADEEKGEEMTPRNIMRIASASKLITAVAIMKLVEEGKLSLDSKIFGEYGLLNDPSFTEAIADERINDITVDHLLRHQGGFTLRAGDPMFNTREIIEAKHLNGAPSPGELICIVLGRRLGFNPGEGRRYSNFGYFLLSEVISKVSGKTYWDYVGQALLRPAEINNFLPATNYYEEKYPEEVRYYGPDNEPVEEFNGSGRLVERVYGGSDVRGLAGAGGWLTSAAGLARFVAAIDGEPGVKDVLNEKSIHLLTEQDDEQNLCRGWSEIKPGDIWTRTGTLSSSHAMIRHFPDGECWVILTNSGVWRGHHFSRELERLINRLKNEYGDKFPRWNLW